MHRIAPVLALSLLVAACSSTEPTTTTAAPATVAPTTTAAIGDEMVTTTTLEAIVEEPLPLPPTPSQQEGPYYPVERLDDNDNDLTVVEGLSGTPSGNVLVLTGTLVTTEGAPVQGGAVEIWQTDANGVYLHPGDPGVADRDPYFQGTGVATVAADGSWSFRTINPGYYEPRPRHIHVKVFVDGQETLTTQIYFSDDPQAAGIDERLVATIAPGTDDGGNPILIADHRFVLPAS